jgi:ATP-dependent protease Clp ATPase subunit
LAEKLLRDVMFELPGNDEPASVLINRAVVQRATPPIVRRKPERAAA